MPDRIATIAARAGGRCEVIADFHRCEHRGTVVVQVASAGDFRLESLQLRCADHAPGTPSDAPRTAENRAAVPTSELHPGLKG